MLHTIKKTYKDIPPGRPMVAAFGSLTDKMSVFVDLYLQPLVRSLPSFVRDTMDFIEGVKNVKLPDVSVLLASIDVESLYKICSIFGWARGYVIV